METVRKVCWLTLFIVFFSASSQADYYKCLVNNKVVYSDSPCGAASQSIKVQSSSKAQSTGSQDDYYSVENQLKRIEQDKALKHQEAMEKQALELERKKQEQLSQQQETNKFDHARCNYYQSLIREQENYMSKGYKNHSERLSDESYINMLRVNAAEYCG